MMQTSGPSKRWLTLSLVVVLTATITCLACLHHLGSPADSEDTATEHAIASATLGEQRHYRVQLPQSYGTSPSRRYPVVYVLDGASQDIHTAQSAALMARIGVIPEVIVVGIPSAGESRNRDYTPPGMQQDLEAKESPEGRADRFLAFLGKELIPEVEGKLRTTPVRVLAGNSRAGLFVVHVMSVEPKLFGAYIANSPALWRDDGEMPRRLVRFLDGNRDTAATLFLSLGSEENDKMKRAFERTVAILRESAPAGVRWHSCFMPGANHGGNAALATPVGLRWAFDPAREAGGYGNCDGG